jgi:hypothetical protein
LAGSLRLSSPWLDRPFHFVLHDHCVNQSDDGILITGVDILKLSESLQQPQIVQRPFVRAVACQQLIHRRIKNLDHLDKLIKRGLMLTALILISM